MGDRNPLLGDCARCVGFRDRLCAEYQRFTLFPVTTRNETHWEEHAKFDRRYSFAFIVVAILGAILIGFVQWIERPTVLVTYTSDSPVASSDAYHCSCALPDYLDDDPRHICPPKPFQLKSCYLLNSPDVETITVVSFSNSTAPEVLDLAYSGEEEFGGAPRPAVFKVIHDTYLMTSSLSELNLWKPDPKKMLAPLYEDFLRYFAGMEIVDMEVDKILDSELFRFPSYYMYMMVQFDCVNYSSCGPSVILSSADPNFLALEIAAPNSTEAVANDWLSCGGYDGGESWDPIRNYYHGRCMIYSTYPTMSSRVKRLLRFLRDCPHIERMGSYSNRTSNVVSFISRMEQVNKSRVAEKQPMVMGFLEVIKGSPQWFRLADHYPGVRSECSASCEAAGGSSRGAWTEVCNASSVCLSYKTAAEVEFSSVRMRCMDLDRYNYTNCVAFANSTGNMDRVDDLCNRDASCKRVPSRKLRRRVESRTELNNMNVKVLESEIKASANAGVCRNVFRNVVRYFSESLDRSVLLETNCSTSAGLCTLTGRYNLVDDEPGTDFPRNLHDEEVVAAANVAKPFVCYGPSRQKFTFWAINLTGVISGWISSMYLVASVLLYRLLQSAIGGCSPAGNNEQRIASCEGCRNIMRGNAPV